MEKNCFGGGQSSLAFSYDGSLERDIPQYQVLRVFLVSLIQTTSKPRSLSLSFSQNTELEGGRNDDERGSDREAERSGEGLVKQGSPLLCDFFFFPNKVVAFTSEPTDIHVGIGLFLGCHYCCVLHLFLQFLSSLYSQVFLKQLLVLQVFFIRTLGLWIQGQLIT